jgi:hypothetical protein
MNTEANTSRHKRNTSGLRPWGKGKSGNPKGRAPKVHATADKLRAALADDLPDIIKGVVDAAKGGDMQAARIILDRALPPLKAAELPAPIAGLKGNLTEQGAAILSAMASGALAPGQGAQLLAALASQAKLLEADELTRRLTELEKRLDARGIET